MFFRSYPLSINNRIVNLEMSYDGTRVVVGDRKDQVVEVYKRNETTLSGNNKYIAVTARKTQVSGEMWKGSAYLM